MHFGNERFSSFQTCRCVSVYSPEIERRLVRLSDESWPWLEGAGSFPALDTTSLASQILTKQILNLDRPRSSNVASRQFQAQTSLTQRRCPKPRFQQRCFTPVSVTDLVDAEKVSEAMFPAEVLHASTGHRPGSRSESVRSHVFQLSFTPVPVIDLVDAVKVSQTMFPVEVPHASVRHRRR